MYYMLDNNILFFYFIIKLPIVVCAEKLENYSLVYHTKIENF